MKQQQFEKLYQGDWSEWDQLMDRIKQRDQSVDLRRLLVLYKKLCNQYAMARSRNYSVQLVQSLSQRAQAGHYHLYRQQLPWLESIFRFLLRDFPAAIHQTPYKSAIMFTLFFAPLFIMGALCFNDDTFIYHVMGHNEVSNMEDMYNPAEKTQTGERDSRDNISMFGLYIFNNISIAFRTFVGGIFVGVGSLFFVVFNGVVIGAVAGHLARLGFEDTFFPFVVGHGSFELTAIAIAGIAGLHMGFAFISPGNRSRWGAVKHASRLSLTLMYGATLFLVIAAFIEAFWSPSSASITSKYVVGAILWLVVIAYLGVWGHIMNKRIGDAVR